MQKEEVKHTPGPWRVAHLFPFKVYAGMNFICDTRLDICHTEQDRANARLIAAAPELLDACQMIAKWMKSEGIAPNRLEVVENAISKALQPTK